VVQKLTYGSFNLAPSKIAKPLPTFNADFKSKRPNKKNNNATPVRKQKQSTTNGYKHDDTPRAFARMLAQQTSKKRQRSDLDDDQHVRKSKKQKGVPVNDIPQDQSQPLEAPHTADVPKILPGERLGDFAARVDQALPVTGLARKGKVNIEGLKERQTKTEKRLHKLYASWREDEARLKEKEEERRELEEEANEERQAEMGGQRLEFPASKRKAKRKRMVGEVADVDDDPWAELKSRREERRGLNDIVQAPPSFKALPKEKFKVKNNAKVDVADVPRDAGSLKKREALSAARKEVIERYRSMMGKSNRKQ
jgi:hypothetical protein